MILAFIDFNFLDFLDIVLVALIIYQVYYLIRGTVAIKIFVGILAIYLAWKLVGALQMEMLDEILGQFIGLGVIALLIVFQQELRQFLLIIGERGLGRRNSFLNKYFSRHQDTVQRDFREVVRACSQMAETKTGALIVLANQSDPEYFIKTKESVDALVTSNLLHSIFYKNSPLHDGAVVIKDGRISCVKGILPVSDNLPGYRGIGMRHRAALGISEVTDCISVVVSEQTGSISIAHQGKLENDLTEKDLNARLQSTTHVS